VDSKIHWLSGFPDFPPERCEISRIALVGGLMCERCAEIVLRILRYGELAKSITDQAALDAIDRLIVAMNATKASLHPNAEK
jgi:hypothetical protein